MSKIIDYLKETKSEAKQIVWPSKRHTMLYTLVVILFSILVAYFLGAFDVLFSFLLGKVIAL